MKNFYKKCVMYLTRIQYTDNVEYTAYEQGQRVRPHLLHGLDSLDQTVMILDAEGPGAGFCQVLRAGQHFHNLHQHLKTNRGFSVADPDLGSSAFWPRDG